jgi:hypothetical protein
MITRPSGDPFQDMCTMIGLMTVVWAWAENALALTIGVITENAGPIKGHTEPPLSLSKRIECFKTALRDVVALKPLQQEGRALATRFTQLGRRRHDFIHGAAWQLQEGEFQSISFGVQAGQHSIKDHRFDISDAVSLNAEVTKLQDDIIAFMVKVLGVFGK